jgi:putative drug exporter of the RND superfamily
MIVSDNRAIGQVGTTIGLGLLFDTLIVRSFMMPSVAALLGRWFWWPMNVYRRPALAGAQPRSRDVDFEEAATAEISAAANGNDVDNGALNGDAASNGTGSMHGQVYHR